MLTIETGVLFEMPTKLRFMKSLMAFHVMLQKWKIYQRIALFNRATWSCRFLSFNFTFFIFGKQLKEWIALGKCILSLFFDAVHKHNSLPVSFDRRFSWFYRCQTDTLVALELVLLLLLTVEYIMCAVMRCSSAYFVFIEHAKQLVNLSPDNV